MDFLKAPTDNLYKFISITGTVIFILMIVLFHQHIEFQLSHAVRLETEQNQHIADLALFVTKLETQNPALDYRTARYVKILEVLGEDDFQKFIVAKGQLRTVESQIDGLNLVRDPLLCGYSVLGFIAFAIAAVGFWFWYEKTQKHLDKLLASGVAPKNSDDLV